ncbi:MAG: helix-turn-helix domain-containing protein [bacterium]|nr:helix-turn-helix domain-containing protein [bacterium]
MLDKITVLTPTEFCREIDVSEKTLKRYLKSFPDFPHFRVGHVVRFVKELAVPYFNRKKKEDCVVNTHANKSMLLEVSLWKH